MRRACAHRRRAAAPRPPPRRAQRAAPTAAPPAAPTAAPAAAQPTPRCLWRRWSRAKFEIATGEEFNPIKQDTKNGKLRDYKCGATLSNQGHILLTTDLLLLTN